MADDERVVIRLSGELGARQFRLAGYGCFEAVIHGATGKP